MGERGGRDGGRSGRGRRVTGREGAIGRGTGINKTVFSINYTNYYHTTTPVQTLQFDSILTHLQALPRIL